MRTRDNQTVAVIGGSVSGLAAAEKLVELPSIERVTVYERQEYDEKRVDCGEAINDASVIPLAKTRANGFVTDVDGFRLEVYDGTDRLPSTEPIGTATLRCEPGYITERDVMERRWAERLEKKGVEFVTGQSISPTEYEDLVASTDYLIDASGQPSLTLKARGETTAYADSIVALNATVEGSFSAPATPRIFFEGYAGYAWLFPKSETHANVGIGWMAADRPDDYFAAFEAAARRNGFPVPARGDTNVDTIPPGPGLHPSAVAEPERGVFLVGDAAGLANRYQGEGICQGIRSAYLLAELIADGTEAVYPRRLAASMRDEYRLAHLMRGVWTEHEDSRLLAALAETLDGATVDEITRQPATVVRRLARRPTTTLRLLADRGMLERLVGSYTGGYTPAPEPTPAE